MLGASLESHTRGHPTAGEIYIGMLNMDKIYGVYYTSIMNNAFTSMLEASGLAGAHNNILREEGPSRPPVVKGRIVTPL